MPRRLSDAGAAFIAGQEGAVPYWYRDALGVWTLGIGHARVGDEFADVATEDDLKGGRLLSDAEMWELFRTDAARYVEAVDRLVIAELTQEQFDRLVDFAFNWGIGAEGGFPATSVLELVNAGKFADVARELVEGRGPPTRNHPEGRPYDKGLAGVRKRRALEAEVFTVSAVEILEAVAAELEAQGIPVAFVPGWRSRGRPYSFNPRGVVCHHTATRAYANDYPSLGIVRDGRSDLPGPLSQIGLGRHTGTVYIIAAGYANHAGGGGWDGLTGNGSVWGIEAENDGTGEAWGPEISRSYIATVAALCRHGGIGLDRVCRHAEWSDGGKIDTATRPFNSGNWIRDQVAAAFTAPPPPPPDPEPEPPEEETTEMPYLINVEGHIFLVFNRAERPLVWIDGPDVGAYEAKFGAALPTTRATAESTNGGPF